MLSWIYDSVVEGRRLEEEGYSLEKNTGPTMETVVKMMPSLEKDFKGLVVAEDQHTGFKDGTYLISLQYGT